MKMLIMPGLFFQRLTTKEPDDEMLEVAIKAVNAIVKTKNSKIKEKNDQT